MISIHFSWVHTKISRLQDSVWNQRSRNGFSRIIFLNLSYYEWVGRLALLVDLHLFPAMPAFRICWAICLFGSKLNSHPSQAFLENYFPSHCWQILPSSLVISSSCTAFSSCACWITAALSSMTWGFESCGGYFKKSQPKCPWFHCLLFLPHVMYRMITTKCLVGVFLPELHWGFNLH